LVDNLREYSCEPSQRTGNRLVLFKGRLSYVVRRTRTSVPPRLTANTSVKKQKKTLYLILSCRHPFDSLGSPPPPPPSPVLLLPIGLVLPAPPCNCLAVVPLHLLDSRRTRPVVPLYPLFSTFYLLMRVVRSGLSPKKPRSFEFQAESGWPIGLALGP
jgi:hypothetical protein